MAVYSMTGYATAQSGGPDSPGGAESRTVLGMEIRSVNSRFLDLTFKMSDELRGTEPALRDLLGARLKRGKVEVRAWIEGRTDGAVRAPTVADLQRLVGLQDTIQAWCSTAAPLSVAEVLQLTSRQQALPGNLNDTLLELAQTVLDSFVAAREREGKRLADMLLDRLKQLRQLASDAQPLIPQLVAQQLVIQQPDITNRRVSRLRLTTQGAALERALRIVVRKHFHRLVPRAPQEEAAVVWRGACSVITPNTNAVSQTRN